MKIKSLVVSAVATALLASVGLSLAADKDIAGVIVNNAGDNKVLDDRSTHDIKPVITFVGKHTIENDRGSLFAFINTSFSNAEDPNFAFFISDKDSKNDDRSRVRVTYRNHGEFASCQVETNANPRDRFTCDTTKVAGLFVFTVKKS